MRDRAPHVVPLAALLALHLFITQAWGQQAPGRTLQIVVAEGEGATNNVRSRANKQVVVRIEDDNHRPVVGAAVYREAEKCADRSRELDITSRLDNLGMDLAHISCEG